MSANEKAGHTFLASLGKTRLRPGGIEATEWLFSQSQLTPGSQVLVMSFSHAEDLEIVAACLRRQRERGDLPFIGLIGSRSKWASFGHRLQARGFSAAELERVTCPIGLPGIRGKQPAVVALAVVAQLLQAGVGDGAEACNRR